MRIGIDIRTLMDNRYSGIPEYSLCLLNELFKIDTENEYVLFYNSFRDLSVQIPEFKFDNVSVVKTAYPNKIFGYFLQTIFAWPKLDRLLNVDVFFMPHLNFFAISPRVDSVITIHDLSFLVHPEFFSLKKNIWHQSLRVRQNLQKFTKIIAISENTKQDLMELCGIEEKRISVVSSGISRDFCQKPINDPRLVSVRQKYNLPDKFILYLGTIEPRKNIDGLIRAYEDLLTESPTLTDYSLVIAGARGWKYKKIIKLWEKSKFRDKIVFTSYIDRDDKVYLYNLAKIFVYPSFYEGFGFPPLEAMACGLPTIASANSSLSEVLGQAAVYVNPHDINSIKLAMRELISDEKLASQMATRGLQNVQKYTWANTAEQTLAIISSGENSNTRLAKHTAQYI